MERQTKERINVEVLKFKMWDICLDSWWIKNENTLEKFHNLLMPIINIFQKVHFEQDISNNLGKN